MLPREVHVIHKRRRPVTPARATIVISATTTTTALVLFACYWFAAPSHSFITHRHRCNHRQMLSFALSQPSSVLLNDGLTEGEAPSQEPDGFVSSSSLDYDSLTPWLQDKSTPKEKKSYNNNRPNKTTTLAHSRQSNATNDDDDDDHSTPTTAYKAVAVAAPSADSAGFYQSTTDASDGRDDPLSVQSFAMDLYNLATDNPQRAQDALEIMLELHQQQQQQQQQANKTSPSWTVQPDVACYRTVVEGWIQVDELDKAQAVLDAMEEQQHILLKQSITLPSNATTTDEMKSERTRLLPSELLYLSMIQAWADDAKDDFAGKSAEKAEALLRRMEDRLGLKPNVKLWTMVLEGWCKRAGIVRGAMARAERLLSEMETNHTTLRPNVLTYTSFIGGIGRCKDKDKARQAEAVLERMQQHGVQPDAVAYTSVINCWSKAVSRRERELAASRSLRLLSEMEHLYISKEMYHVKPSLITYQTVIGAIGNSLDPAASELAQDVLKRMYALHKSGTIANLKPTTSVYNAVIYALSQAPSESRLRHVRRAEQILNEMVERAKKGEKDVQPDVRTWAAVLRAWARSGSFYAAENAQRVLDKLEAAHQRGETNIRPNFVCYTTVMGAYGFSRKKGSLDKMESILKQMEQGYEETLEPDIRPNTVSYVTAIDAFVRRNEKDAAQRAQATVDRMMKLYSKGLGHVRPTRIVFNTLIHAWSKSKEKGAAVKAEKIFKWMEAQYQAGDDLVRPDEVSMCAVLNAWANQAEYGGAERALQIWEHSETVSIEERGFPSSIMMPNIVIKAIARSKDRDAVKKAEGILLRLESEFRSGKSLLRPDVTTYSSVINACAYYKGDREGRTEALQTALRTFNKLSDMEDDSPNNITYGTVFKAIANLMPVGNDREELVRRLFDQCIEEGLVDSFVLSQVRNASPQLYRDLVDEPCGLGGPGADDSIECVLRNVPPAWAANVVYY